jgi:hypothetical protein
MSVRRFAYLVCATAAVVLAAPATVLAIAPVDSSGASAPSDPKVNPQAAPTEPKSETPSGSPMMGTTGSGPPAASTSGGSEPSGAPAERSGGTGVLVDAPAPGGAAGTSSEREGTPK